jgi:hypothetical protein
MSLLGILLLLVIIGVALHYFNASVTMDGRIKGLINAIVIIVTLVWLGEEFGLFDLHLWHARVRP